MGVLLFAGKLVEKDGYLKNGDVQVLGASTRHPHTKEASRTG